MKALLLLGANLGDRAGNLRRAIDSLGKVGGVRVTKASRIYETAPVGPSDKPYLNQAIAVETSRSPMGLLLEAKILEAAAGRRPAARWSARILDVDLIAYGRARAKTAWLTIPHPGAAGRAFALAPLADVSGGWKPDGRRSARAILRTLKPDHETVHLWK